MRLKIVLLPEKHLWINSHLVRAALQEQKEMPGVSLAVQSGDAWASLKMAAAQWAPLASGAIEGLDAWTREQIAALVDPQLSVRPIEWWFTIMGPSGQIAEHDHHMAKLSGIYYPETFLGQGGELFFTRAGSRFTPREGLLLIFDRSEPHFVSPVQSIAPRLNRISMSFNVM